MGVKGYKAFEKGMVCRGKQYAENTVFEEETAEVCRSGMHFCNEENALEVLSYYPLVDYNGNVTEFAKVEALDEALTDDGKKYCTKKLKIGAKVHFADLVNATVNFGYEKMPADTKQQCTSRDHAKIGSSGNCAQIGSSGYGAKIGSSGNYAVIMCAGINCCAKAKKGSWITLAEWEIVDDKYVPVCVKTEQVDGEQIKEDTFYKLLNGEFTEMQGV